MFVVLLYFVCLFFFHESSRIPLDGCQVDVAWSTLFSRVDAQMVRALVCFGQCTSAVMFTCQADWIANFRCICVRCMVVACALVWGASMRNIGDRCVSRRAVSCKQVFTCLLVHLIFSLVVHTDVWICKCIAVHTDTHTLV